MKSPLPNRLTRRERQIMDVVYERAHCSAREIHAAIADAPSYSAVRALLSILVEKGHLSYKQDGAKYLYYPEHPIEKARQGAVSRLITTFFKGSTADAVSALIGNDGHQLSDRELDALSAMIDEEKSKRAKD